MIKQFQNKKLSTTKFHNFLRFTEFLGSFFYPRSFEKFKFKNFLIKDVVLYDKMNSYEKIVKYKIS